MIRDITISATGTGDDQYYEPPARVLSLAVTGGDAYLAIYEHGNAERTAGPAWAAPRFPDSGIGAISCCTLPVQVLVVDFLRSPVAER